MTQEEIIKLAHAAGFNWPDIQATTIEQRLERFAFLVAATEREKFTNTQEFVTLPREIVEQALEALLNEGNFRKLRKPLIEESIKQIKAALEQPQAEQEPVAGVVIRDGLPCLLQDRHIKSTDHRVYTHPQPKREPLTDEQSRRIYNEATYHASIAVFMTRMDAEYPYADDKGVSGWLQEAEYRVKSRITEAAHNIK